tara:strand:- start:389 stop:571 length:183 start_codon:yes stop_codon:yes gene_type:complete
MKVGDLVKQKNEVGALGLIMELNTHAEPSFGPCWYVFWFAPYNKIFPSWKSEIEVISESR